jgi:GT2 family glycosyltransferase
MDEKGRDVGRLNAPDYDPHLLLHTNLVHCCFLYRCECLERVGGYDPAFMYSEDWEYWIRISQYYRMKRVPQALYRYRYHSMSMSSKLIRGTAQNMKYADFAAQMRQRMPVRWYVGKLKWLWLQFARTHHPILAERARLQGVSARAAMSGE